MLKYALIWKFGSTNNLLAQILDWAYFQCFDCLIACKCWFFPSPLFGLFYKKKNYTQIPLIGTIIIDPKDIASGKVVAPKDMFTVDGRVYFASKQELDEWCAKRNRYQYISWTLPSSLCFFASLCFIMLLWYSSKIFPICKYEMFKKNLSFSLINWAIISLIIIDFSGVNRIGEVFIRLKNSHLYSSWIKWIEVVEQKRMEERILEEKEEKEENAIETVDLCMFYFFSIFLLVLFLFLI